MVPYLDDHLKLGRFLDAGIDVGPVMVAKKLARSCQVFTAQILGPCLRRVHQKLSPQAVVNNLMDLGIEDML